MTFTPLARSSATSGSVGLMCPACARLKKTTCAMPRLFSLRNGGFFGERRWQLELVEFGRTCTSNTLGVSGCSFFFCYLKPPFWGVSKKQTHPFATARSCCLSVRPGETNRQSNSLSGQCTYERVHCSNCNISAATRCTGTRVMHQNQRQSQNTQTIDSQRITTISLSVAKAIFLNRRWGA